MTTSTATTGVASIHAAASLLAAHLTEHGLPEPASLTVMTGAHRAEVQAQVHPHTVAGVAAELVTWAETLKPVTVTMWRPPHGDRVHLSMTGTLIGPLGAVGLDVYGAVGHDPAVFADLASGEDRPVSLDHLRAWAQSSSPTTDSAALDTDRAPR